MASKMKCILASIFSRFWWILGGMLGAKIEQKSIPKGINKNYAKKKAYWSRLRGVLERLGSFFIGFKSGQAGFEKKKKRRSANFPGFFYSHWGALRVLQRSMSLYIKHSSAL